MYAYLIMSHYCDTGSGVRAVIFEQSNSKCFDFPVKSTPVNAKRGSGSHTIIAVFLQRI